MAQNKDFASRGQLWLAETLPGGALGLEQQAADIPGFSLEITNDRQEVVTVESDGVAGFSAGIVKTKVTFKTALPKVGRGGRKLPVEKLLIENRNVAITIRLDSGDRYAIYGVMKSAKTDFELGKAIYKDCSFEGGKPELMSDSQ